MTTHFITSDLLNGNLSSQIFKGKSLRKYQEKEKFNNLDEI